MFTVFAPNSRPWTRLHFTTHHFLTSYIILLHPLINPILLCDILTSMLSCAQNSNIPT